MTPLPLRTSLTLAYTGLLATLLTALGLAYHTALVRHLEDEATTSLDAEIRTLRDYLHVEDGLPVLIYSHQDPEVVAFINDATQYYQVYDAASGRLLTQSAGLESVGLQYTPEEVAAFVADPRHVDIQTDFGRIRLASLVVAPAPGPPYLLQIGEPMARIDRTLLGFDRLLIWRILAGIAGAALLGGWLARRALGPLTRLAEATQRIGITNLDARLPLRGAGDEIDQVTQAFNRALARVETSVGEMRQFSGALAHELRTPLAILRGEAELALAQVDSPDAMRGVLAGQIEEFDRLTRLINQLLTLARAESGQIALAEDAVDLARLSASVAEQIQPVAEAQGIILSCTCEPAGAAALVTGDAGWLERLLLILLDNALKFTPVDGRVTMTVTPSADAVQIAVRDTGIGIAPEAQPHLFERFYRVERARGRETPGAGLGLALAAWIVARHHGRIDVSSEVGAGSLFTVTLPARLAEASRDATPAAPAAIAAGGARRSLNAS